MSILAWMPGPPELIVIGVVAVLVFGRRLPQVGLNLGRSLVQFKKGLRGDKDENGEVEDVVDVGDRTDKAAE